MGGTCLQSFAEASRNNLKKMFSLKVVLLVVTVVVPYTVARPQDFSNIFGSLNDELTKIVDQTVFQSQSTSPGLRINPSRNQNSGTRYSFGNRPTGGFTVLNGGDLEETQGPGLRSSAPKNPGSGSSLAFLPIYYLILKHQTFVLPHQPEAAVLISPHQKVKSMVHENPFQFLLVSVFPVTISYSDLIPTESIPDLFVV